MGDVGDRVDEADLGGEEGVAGILDQLSRLWIGSDDRRRLGTVEPAVELCELVGGFLVVRSDYYFVGVEGVVDRGSLFQELGVSA